MMNKTREVRELHFSSTQLIILFLAILILGVFIFLLGVSVGKKQVLLSQEAGSVRKPSTVALKRTVPTAPPATEPSPIEKEIASHQKQTESALPMTQPGTKSEAKPAAAQEKPASVTTPPQTTTAKTTAGAPKTAATKTPAKTQPTASKTAASTRTTAPAVKTAAPVKGLYYIQLAAFDEKKAAEEYAVEIKAAGFPTIIMAPLATDKKPWYRVRVGGYPTKEDAEQAVLRLKAMLTKKKFEYWITRD